jgi:undecaprenyl-diphosphatase
MKSRNVGWTSISLMIAYQPAAAATIDSRPHPETLRMAFRTVLLFLTGALLVLSLLPLDEVLRTMRSQSPEVLYLAGIVSRSGNHGYLLPGGLLLASIFFALRHVRAGRLVLVVLLSSLVAGLCGTVLRSVVGRTRPEARVEQGWYGPRKDGQWIVGRYAYAAFPSGHTSTAAGLGLILFGRRKTAGFAGLAYALAVGWGRFTLGAHRPSDIAAGLVVGGITAMLLWPKLRNWVERVPQEPAKALGS